MGGCLCAAEREGLIHLIDFPLKRPEFDPVRFSDVSF